MGVGNKRPLLIALGIGVAAACGLFLAWEKQAEREEAAATAADTSFADTALASYGGKPSPAEIRAEVEKLLKGNRPDTMMRVMRREDVLPGKGPFIGL
jgi:tRNA nucleotidyltransferase/poly(A) polymerase